MLKYFLFLILFLVIGCGNQIGDSGDNRDNDNSVTNIDFEPNEDDFIPPGVDPAGDNPQCLNNPQPIENGFLLKPISDSDGNVVILLGYEFTTPFESVSLERLDGTFEECRFTTNEDNGNRQHWRCSMPGSAYTGLIIAKEPGNICTWDVPNPSERTE